MPNNYKADFVIDINFKKDSERPARVFETMASLINAFQEFDKDLVKSIDNNIEPILLLEDIEIGSLRAWLVSLLKGIPEEALSSLDWKKAVGSYLVKAKHIVVKRLEDKTTITDASFIEDIQYELVEEAEKTGVKAFPSYSPIQLKKLVDNISSINKSLEPLEAGDSVKMQSKFGNATFNLDLNFTPESIEDILTKETISTDHQMILKIKKPDYLGNAMWDFKHSSRIIPAKILDSGWLTDFHERKIDIRPGDSIRAIVKTLVKYGHDNEVIAYHYEVLQVLEVLQAKGPSQTMLEM